MVLKDFFVSFNLAESASVLKSDQKRCTAAAMYVCMAAAVQRHKTTQVLNKTDVFEVHPNLE